MRIVEFPSRAEWPDLVRRPSLDTFALYASVADILQRVRTQGDAALYDYTREFDGVELSELAVLNNEFDLAESLITNELKAAISVAAANIEKFHLAESAASYEVETTPGVFCSKRWLPIDRVGIYVPAGSAPLFSTVLMLAIPARLAGCREIVLCSPPQADGAIDPAVLYTAQICGVTQVFKVGGAQAIAAMAFGTETIPKVFKVFGPGNQYVTEAKLQIMRSGIGIDMPAGPSEVAILADETCEPEFVAADLLSQAEHGADSQVILVTTSRAVIAETLACIERQVAALPRSGTARSALVNSTAVLVDSINTALELLNHYAPEHLIVATENAQDDAEKIVNAGSIFIGNYSCESAGDYASGTNHTLPTNGAARAYSGVSVLSFMKAITYQRITADGIKGLGPVIATMAAAERLDAHKNAVTIRLERLAKEGL